jgi:CRP-like cAMP-binding protein
VVSNLLQAVELKNDSQVYQVGDRADTIYVVISGFIILRRPLPGGGSRERLIGPGAVFGAAEVLCGSVRSASARAHGDARITTHLPEEILNAMLDQPETADAMVASLLANRQRKPLAADGVLETIGPNNVQLMPLDTEIIDQFGGEPLLITVFPFIIGRKSEKSAPDVDLPVSLSLVDKRPYNLSQCHFSIDREDGQFCVRDYRSYHGTIVNGGTVGSKAAGLKAALQPGENEIIAGAAESPFRFSCLVPRTQTG